jgi:hypothetical protein
MTSEAFSSSALRAYEDHTRSFWRRLLEKITVARQQKADQYIREYLRRHQEYQHE